MQAAACQTISFLATTRRNRELMMSEENAVTLLFRALTLHRDSVQVQENATKAISYLLRGKDIEVHVINAGIN